MPTTFSLPGPDVTQLLAEVMRANHKPLADAGVAVGVLMASELKHNGYAAFGSIRVVSLKDRFTKRIDAEMLLDATEWERMRDRHKAALIDHELSHLQLAKFGYRKPEGAADDAELEIYFDTDDIARPKLRLVKGDLNVGDAFAAVIARHGDYAVEFLSIRKAQAFATAAKAGKLDEWEG